MYSYLKDRRQAVQINNNFSSYKKVQPGVLQGSIDDLLLFNLFVNDLVLFLSKTFLSNYADDNNLYSIGKELNIIEEMRRKDFKVVTDWFFESYVKRINYATASVTTRKVITLERYLLKIKKK